MAQAPIMALNNAGRFQGMIVRYIVIFVSIFNIWIFEYLLTYPTITVLTALLKLFYEKVIVMGSYLYVNGQGFEIESTCVMGIIYWLLFVLVSATADLKAAKRISAISFAWLFVFIFNIARMLFLVSISDSRYFNAIHWTFENIITLFLIILVWGAIIKFLNIKAIPFYSDLKILRQKIFRKE